MKNLFIAFFLVFSFYSSFATIHYFEAGVTVNSSNPRYFDIDLDGDNDFFFTAVDIGPNTGSTAFYVNSSKSTSYYAADGVSDTLPKAYNQGAALGTHNWRNPKGLLSSPSIGFFRNDTKYLMVKFNDTNNNTYYGWFLLTTGFSMEVIAYAYSDVPDEIIAPGETEPTGIHQINIVSYEISNLNTRHIAFKDCAGYNQVEIHTVDGKLISKIINPVAFQNYSHETQPGMLLLSFFREGRMLHSGKYFVNSN